MKRARWIGLGLGAAVVLLVALNVSTNHGATSPQPVAAPKKPGSTHGGCVIRALSNQVPNFVERVRQNLRNPASFEHVRSEVGPVEDGVFAVIMTYRATNGFGAVDTGVAMGEVRVSDCAPKLVTMD